MKGFKLSFHFFLSSFLVPIIIYFNKDLEVVNGMLLFSNFSLISGLVEAMLLVKRRHDYIFERELSILIGIVFFGATLVLFTITSITDMVLLVIVLLRVFSTKFFYEMHCNEDVRDRALSFLYWLNILKFIVVIPLLFTNKLNLVILTIFLLTIHSIECFVFYRYHRGVFVSSALSVKGFKYFFNHFFYYSLFSFIFFIFFRNQIYEYDKGLLKDLIFAVSVFGIFSVTLNVFISKYTSSLKEVSYQKSTGALLSIFCLLFGSLLFFLRNDLSFFSINFWNILIIHIFNLPNAIMYVMLPVNNLSRELVYISLLSLLLIIALGYFGISPESVILTLVFFHHMQGVILSQRIKFTLGIFYNLVVILLVSFFFLFKS